MVESGNIICDKCKLEFERTKEFKYCSNCFACSGCEVYYCPGCDTEIIVKPITPFDQEVKRTARRSKRKPG